MPGAVVGRCVINSEYVIDYIFFVKKPINDDAGRLHQTVISQQNLALQKQQTQRNIIYYVLIMIPNKEEKNL